MKLKDALQAHSKDQKTKVPTQQVKFYRKKKIIIARQRRDFPTRSLWYPANSHFQLVLKKRDKDANIKEARLKTVSSTFQDEDFDGSL